MKAKNKLKKSRHIPQFVILVGQEGMLELQDGTITNSQARVQYEMSLHNQTKRVINATQKQMVQWIQQGQLQTQALHGVQPLGRSITPLFIVCFVIVYEGYIQMTYFLGLPSGSPKIGTLFVLKLWMFIFFSNHYCLKHARKISYSPQKDISNGVPQLELI